jgi:hypothetical protein
LTAKPNTQRPSCEKLTAGISAAAISTPGTPRPNTGTARSTASPGFSNSTWLLTNFSVAGMPGFNSCSRLNTSAAPLGAQLKLPKSARGIGAPINWPLFTSSRCSTAASEPCREMP